MLKQELEFSSDLKRPAEGSPTSMPGTPPLDNPDLLLMSPATRAKRQRIPSVLLTTQPGETQIVATPGSRSRQYQFCHRLVRDILKNKDSISFSQPVSELWQSDAIPGYDDIITNPMDLRTVMRKMESGAYVSCRKVTEVLEHRGKRGVNVRLSSGKLKKFLMYTLFLSAQGPNPEKRQEEFDTDLWAADMRTIFQNAMTYNRVGDVIYEAANNLLQKFERKFLELPQKGDLVSPKRSSSSKKKKARSADKKHHSKHHKKRTPEHLTPDQRVANSADKPRRTKSKASSKDVENVVRRKQQPYPVKSSKILMSRQQSLRKRSRSTVFDVLLIRFKIVPGTGGGRYRIDHSRARTKVC